MRLGVLSLRRRQVIQVALVVGVLVVLAFVPTFLSPYYTFVTTRILIFAVFAMALNLVFGQGGLPSLGHAAFFGIGGYTVAIGLTRWGWGFWTILAVAVLLGLVLGATMGFLTIKTEGIYLLLLTLAFAQALWALAFEWVQLTRGDNGIAGIRRDTIPFGFSDDYHTFVVIVASLLVGVMWIWTRSPAGRVLVGARESKSRMEALGYRVWRYRLAAFALSGAVSAIAGLLLVYLQGIASPELLHWPLSAQLLVMTIIGGVGTFLGPAVGAAAVVGLQEYISTFTERWTTVLGILFILSMLFLREGLTGLASRFVGGEAPRGAEELTAPAKEPPAEKRVTGVGT